MRVQNKQAGNVLFLILIAVALFAALSYAVTQSTRGGGNASDETSILDTAEIIQYGSQIKVAIDRMKIINGFQNWEICLDNDAWGHTNYNYASCNDPKTNVFNSNGGGVSFSFPNEEWLDTSHSAQPRFGRYIFQKWNVEGIGDDGSGPNNGNELVMFLPYIKADLCTKINNELGIVNTSGDAPVEPAGYSPVYFHCTFGENGSWCYGALTGTTVALDGTNDELVGQETGCARWTNGINGQDHYMYYQVLVQR